MNFLAHLSLVPRESKAQIGTILGDFVKGPLQNSYGNITQNYIKIHRKIDVFTDNHPIVKRSKCKISNKRSRFSSILVDIFYDYFLSNNWTYYNNDDFENFIKVLNSNLYSNLHNFPPKGVMLITYWKKNNTLLEMNKIPTIKKIIDRIGKRNRNFTPLIYGCEELENNYKFFERDFYEFMPILKKYAIKLTINEKNS